MLRRTSVFVFAAAICVCAVRVALAEEPAKDAPKPGDASAATSMPANEGDEHKSLAGYYGRVAKEAKLTKEQLIEFSKKVKELSAKAKEWDEKNGGKLAELTKAVEDAVKAGKKESIEAAKAELKKLRDDKEKLHEILREEIMSILSDEQKAIIKEANFYYGIVGRFKAAKLTEDQKEKIRTICKDAFKEVLAAKDAAAVEAAKKNLVEKISREVLNDDQRKLLEAVKGAKDDGQDDMPAAPK